MKYWAVLIFNMRLNLVYPLALFATLLSTLVSIFVAWYIWQRVFREQDLVAGMNAGQMFTYIVFSRIFTAHHIWNLVRLIGQRIQSGDILIDLLRPMQLQTYYLVGRAGDLLFMTLFIGTPTLLIVLPLGQLQIPHGLSTYLLFFTSLLLSLMAGYILEFWIASLAFYTNYSWGLESLYRALLLLFAGGLFPLQLLPEPLLMISNILPFKDILYTPVAIFSGMVPSNEIPSMVTLQLVKVLILFTLSRFTFARLLQNLAIQRG